MPNIDLLFIAETLQKMEVYSESVCLHVSNTDREHLSGTLALLRKHYDDRIEGMRREVEKDLLNVY
jgi:hypothetical protein